MVPRITRTPKGSTKLITLNVLTIQKVIGLYEFLEWQESFTIECPPLGEVPIGRGGNTTKITIKAKPVKQLKPSLYACSPLGEMPKAEVA